MPGLLFQGKTCLSQQSHGLVRSIGDPLPGQGVINTFKCDLQGHGFLGRVDFKNIHNPQICDLRGLGRQRLKGLKYICGTGCCPGKHGAVKTG